MPVTTAYQQNLLNYLGKNENSMPRIYIDTKGNLTGGMGTMLVNNIAKSQNDTLFISQLLPADRVTAQKIIDLYKTVAESVVITTQSAFDASAFKVKLSAVFDVSFEPVQGTYGKPWTINIKGFKNADGTITPIADLITRTQAAQAALDFIKAKGLESKIDQAFGSSATSLTEAQRFALIDVGYNAGPGALHGILPQFVKAYNTGNDVALLNAFTTGKAGSDMALQNRALQDFADFKGLTITPDATGGQSVYSTDAQGNDVVYRYSAADKGLVRDFGHTVQGVYQVDTAPIRQLVKNPELLSALLASDLASTDYSGVVGLMDRLVNVSAATNALAGNGVMPMNQANLAITTEFANLRSAWMNDPNSTVTTDANGQLTIKTGGNTYLLADNGLLSRVTMDVNGSPNGMSVLTGGSAGNAISFTASSNIVLTDAQAIELGSKMVNSFVATGNPIATGGAIAPGNFDGVINASLTEMGTGKVLSDLTVQNVWNGGTQVSSISTNYNHSTGITTQTVDTTLNGNAVNVTYTYDNVTGQPIPHVNSINGQPPTDQAAADAGLLNSGVLPGQLMFGDTGVSGTNASGVVSTFDAVHPNGLQALTTALATIIDTLAFIKAIQTGQPLPVVASGLRLANTLTGNASHTLAGAANIGSGALSLLSLDAALKRGDAVGAVTAGAQTLSYGATAYADFVKAELLPASPLITQLGTTFNGVSATYGGYLNWLNNLAAQEQTLNPGSSIGVIANRLPGLSYRNYSGYQITDIDPLTGVQRNPDTKYDLTGHPYNAPAGSVQASQSLSERMIRVALERGAIAPTWEVQTVNFVAANDTCWWFAA